MYSQYADWYHCHPNLRVTSSDWDKMRYWCREQFGLVKPTNPNHVWNWCYDLDCKPWFVFKNRDDYIHFLLVWSDYFE